MENLKHINITINSQNNQIYYFIQLIQISKNLESLIIRLKSDRYEDINLILSLIGDLKKLKVVNITHISSFKFEFPLDRVIEKFPNLKNKINNFEEFKINNIGFKKELNDNIKIMTNIKLYFNLKKLLLILIIFSLIVLL